jgi:hypothetical protein
MPKTKIPAEYISDNPSLSGTDSVKVPAGTTAQRGTGVAGKFRFNTTLNKFEGYTDSWGEIGGSGGSALETDNFTGDDSTTAFTLSSSVSDEDNLIVFIDGVYQNKADYVASGTTLTLDTAPVAGRKIVVYHVRANVSGSNCILNSFSGNGSTTAFTLTQNPASENNTQVFIDGVYQRKSSYAVSGTTLTFDAAPGNGTAIEVMMFTQTDINTLPASFVSGLTEVTAVGADHMMIFDATDSALKKALVSDVIEGTTTTINTNADNRVITGSGTANTLNGESNLTFDGSKLGIGSGTVDETIHVQVSSGDAALKLEDSSGDYVRIDQNSVGANDKIRFKSGSSLNEAMRINSSQHLLITGGDTNDRGGRLQVYGKTSTSASTFRVGTNGYPAINLLNQDAAQQGYIVVNSSSVSYTSVSDHRLKENVADMTGAIDRVKQLQPKRFNFIADDTDTTVDGFLAHEAQAVVAEAVTGTHNEVDDDDNPIYQGIDQSKLVPLLTGALKEAITKIEALETRIETLENA